MEVFAIRDVKDVPLGKTGMYTADGRIRMAATLACVARENGLKVADFRVSLGVYNTHRVLDAIEAFLERLERDPKSFSPGRPSIMLQARSRARWAMAEIMAISQQAA